MRRCSHEPHGPSPRRPLQHGRENASLVSESLLGRIGSPPTDRSTCLQLRSVARSDFPGELVDGRAVRRAFVWPDLQVRRPLRRYGRSQAGAPGSWAGGRFRCRRSGCSERSRWWWSSSRDGAGAGDPGGDLGRVAAVEDRAGT
jgi:hypothetical protein